MNFSTEEQEIQTLLVKTFEFTIQQYCAEQRISAQLLAHSTDVRMVYNHVTREVTIGLLRKLLTDSKEVNEVIEVPTNWLEALKERWLPSWILRRWPVKTRKIETKITIIEIETSAQL